VYFRNMNRLKGEYFPLSARILRSLFFVCGLLACPLFLMGQQLNFHNLNEASSSESYCVLQDTKGFIWFSTEKGLYRYDGRTYKNFNSDNGLPHSSVFQLCEDSKGRILFNSLHKVGFVFNDSIFFPQLNRKLSEFLTHGALIFNLYIDDNHILWIGTYKGLFRTLKPDDYSDIEEVKPLGADSARVIITILDNKTAIYSINHGKCIMNNGTFSYHLVINNNEKYYNIPYTTYAKDLDPSQFSTILAKDGNILWSCANKLYTIRRDGTFSIKKYETNIIYLYQDKEGGIWVGLTNKGACYYKNSSLEGKPVVSLQDISVSYVFEDNENGFWISTLGRGIFHANSKWVTDYSNHNGLNKKIAAIGVLNNKILVNDYNSFISVIEDTSIKEVFPSGDCTIKSVCNYYNFEDKLYITCFPSLLTADTSFTKWSILTEKKSKRGILLYDLAESPSGKKYGVSYASIYNVNKDSISVMDMLPSRCACVCVTGKGEILAGCEKGLYNYVNEKCIDINQLNGLPQIAVHSIREDIDGAIWTLTNGDGIYVYRHDKLIKTISVKNGLASNYTHAIVFDDKGNAWVGTDNGLSKISIHNNYSISNFDIRHGLISNEVLRLALKGNSLWVGTVNGLCMADITRMGKNTVPPPVYIGSVLVNDSAVKNVEIFPHNFNNFKFHLLAPTFKDEASRFVYQLIGFDTIWRSADVADISFTNLPSGTYRFKAKALNADGVASIHPAEFSFVILNPFWKKWWFILLEILFLAALIYAFVQFRLRIIRQSEAEKTRINKMVTEYQMTALRAQMNPHFVFNAINSIQEYVLDNEPQKAYDYLTKFAQLVRMVLNNAKEKSISLENEIETLQAYVELEQLRFGNKFDFIMDVDNSADQYNIQLPAMIIQPYVENAIWHGLMPLGTLKKGTLKVSIEQNGNELKIIIEDNGIGREKSALIKKTMEHKSVGMELTKQRLDMLNSLPEYSASSIDVFDLHNQEGQATGTRVEIKITTNPY
jgi:ligand-binding sensor domain-containing protein